VVVDDSSGEHERIETRRRCPRPREGGRDRLGPREVEPDRSAPGLLRDRVGGAVAIHEKERRPTVGGEATHDRCSDAAARTHDARDPLRSRHDRILRFERRLSAVIVAADRGGGNTSRLTPMADPPMADPNG
jgi:hypothetical protein